MNGSHSSAALLLVEPLLYLVALLCVRGKQGMGYRFLCMFLVCHLCSAALFVPILIFAGHGIDARLAYRAYFYLYWIDFVVETALSFLVIYSIFDLALAPLEGIRRLGILVFRWAVCISLVVTLASLLGSQSSSPDFVVKVITQLQNAEGLSILCLLLFVCFAIRPLGLSYRSRIFGTLLGFGLLATSKLVTFGWMATGQQIHSRASIADGVATCVALLIWIGYFALPEQRRRIVVLPTTSPFLRWNQISQALGDAPGFVAIGGIPPELFAPAELEVMRRASLQMMGTQTPSLERSRTA